MRISDRFPLAGIAVFALALIASSGCEKKEEASEKAESQAEAAASPGAATSAAAKPAEPNSFDQVAAQLDRGGSLYFYLSTEQFLSRLSRQITSFRDIVLSTPQMQEPAQREKALQAFKVLDDVVSKSGVEDVTGFGMSSFAVEPGLYRNKVFVHHYAGKGTGFLWSAFGAAPHPLKGLDMLPANTALASFSDIELARLVNGARREIEQSNIPEAKQALENGMTQFSAVAGMSFDDLLKSLGSSVGMVLTLDPAKPVTIPIANRSESIPAPRLAILLQVNDDRIFKRIDQTAGGMPGVVKTDEPELRMRTMPVPALPELELRPAVAQWGDYLILSSHESLIRDLIATSKAGAGLKSTPEFKKLAEGLPEQGNSFQVATQLFADTVIGFQRDAMKNQPGSTPQQSALMEKLLTGQKANAGYSVSAHIPDGWLTVSKGSNGASRMLAPLVIVPAALAAGIAVPVFTKVQEKGKAVKSLSQAKQIALACKLYALDHDGKFPPDLNSLTPNYLKDSRVLISPFAPSVPIGYDYAAGMTEKNLPSTVLVEDKFSSAQHMRVVAHVDGSGELIPKTPGDANSR